MGVVLAPRRVRFPGATRANCGVTGVPAERRDERLRWRGRPISGCLPSLAAKVVAQVHLRWGNRAVGGDREVRGRWRHVSENFGAEAGVRSAGFTAGSRIAGYRLEEQIGAGGMAVVFRARDERLQRLVALKILAPALMPDEAFRQRFIRESRAAAAVDDPHIIPVFDAGEAEGALFIAMRYVPAGDVRALVRRTGPLSPERALAIISPIASALDAAHIAGLVHRDVKPENMLVDARPGRPDHVYLSDFGLSKGVMASLGPTGSGQWLGTAGYSPPEQMAGRPVDGRADQYSLACVAFELLCGELPFPRDHVTAVIWAHMSEPPPKLASRRPGFPSGADSVLGKALAKPPEGRYASCREFAGALREALDLTPYDSASEHGAPANAAQRRQARQAAVADLDKTTAPHPVGPREARHGLPGQDGPLTPPPGRLPDVLLSHAVTETSNVAWARGSAKPPAGAGNFRRSTSPAGDTNLGSLPRSRTSTRVVALSVAAVVAVLGSVAGLVITRLPHHPPQAGRSQPASYTFPVQRYGNGLQIARKWTLSGNGGSQLTETITASSATGKPITAWFQDSIPDAITTNVYTALFHPDSIRVVRADPVVEWHLRLPAHGTITLGYVIAVAPEGMTTARLADWAKGLDAVEMRLNAHTAGHPRSAATARPSSGAPAGAPASTSSASSPVSPTPRPSIPTPSARPTFPIPAVTP